MTDPLEKMARIVYALSTRGARLGRELGIDPIICGNSFLQWAEEYRADGLMGHLLISCHPATYLVLHVANLLREKLKVPSVIVEGDVVDQRLFNAEEVQSKVEAFIETMDYYRELRKREGLSW